MTLARCADHLQSNSSHATRPIAPTTHVSFVHASRCVLKQASATPALQYRCEHPPVRRAADFSLISRAACRPEIMRSLPNSATRTLYNKALACSRAPPHSTTPPGPPVAADGQPLGRYTTVLVSRSCLSSACRHELLMGHPLRKRRGCASRRSTHDPQAARSSEIGLGRRSQTSLPGRWRA